MLSLFWKISFLILLGSASQDTSLTQTLSAETNAKVTAFLMTYDAAWLSGEVDQLLALFVEDSPALAKLQEHYAFFRKSTIVQFRSDLLQGREAEGNLGIYAISKYTTKKKSASQDAKDNFEVANFLLLFPKGDSYRVFIIEEFDPKLRNYLQAEKLTCKACNYDLRRPLNWFSIPRKRGWSPCTAAISFVHPSGKLLADFVVLESLQDVNPQKILQEDNQHLIASLKLPLNRLEPIAQTTKHISASHEGFEYEARLQGNQEQEKIRLLRCYLTQGPVLYSLNIYGQEKEFQADRQEIEMLKNSLHILDPNRAVRSLRSNMKSQHNPGGKLQGNIYQHQELGIQLRAPQAWQAEEYSGPALFHVCFHHPQNEQLLLDFYALENSQDWSEQDILLQIQRRYAAHMLTQPKRAQHLGMQSYSYVIESTNEEATAPRREKTAFIPAGKTLYVLRLIAPEGVFALGIADFEATLSSLSRN